MQKVVQKDVPINALLGVPDVLLIAVVIVAADVILVVLEGVKQELKQDLHALVHHVKVNVKVIVQVDARGVLQFVVAHVALIVWTIVMEAAVVNVWDVLDAMDVLVPAVKIAMIAVLIDVMDALKNAHHLAEQNVKDVVVHAEQLALVVKDAVVVTHHVETDVELVVLQDAVQHALVAVLMLALAVQTPAAQLVQIIAMVVAMVLVQLNVLELV